MLRWKIWLPLLLLLSMGASFALPRLMNSGSEQLGYTCLRPSEWLQRFYKAVDRGELTLFVDVLTRDQIVPREVEQRFVLESGINTIVIHVDLLKPRDLPGQENVEIRRISCELDVNGQIVETRAHVYAKPGAVQSE